jgi:hypothetical protein
MNRTTPIVKGAWLWSAGFILLILSLPTTASAHDCGPTLIELRAGDDIKYIIQADGFMTKYKVLTNSNASVAGIDPGVEKEFVAVDGMFTITARTRGETDITISWDSRESEGKAGQCMVKVVVRLPGALPPGQVGCNTEELIYRNLTDRRLLIVGQAVNGCTSAELRALAPGQPIETSLPIAAGQIQLVFVAVPPRGDVFFRCDGPGQGCSYVLTGGADAALRQRVFPGSFLPITSECNVVGGSELIYENLSDHAFDVTVQVANNCRFADGGISFTQVISVPAAGPPLEGDQIRQGKMRTDTFTVLPKGRVFLTCHGDQGECTYALALTPVLTTPPQGTVEGTPETQVSVPCGRDRLLLSQPHRGADSELTVQVSNQCQDNAATLTLLQGNAAQEMRQIPPGQTGTYTFTIQQGENIQLDCNGNRPGGCFYTILRFR